MHLQSIQNLFMPLSVCHQNKYLRAEAQSIHENYGRQKEACQRGNYIQTKRYKYL